MITQYMGVEFDFDKKEDHKIIENKFHPQKKLLWFSCGEIAQREYENEI